MENKQGMKKYELVYIIDGRLSEDAKKEAQKSVADLVLKEGGKIINTQVWLEKHKFAFEIKKCREGAYYLLNLECETEKVAKMRRALGLSEQVLRFEFILAA